MTDVDAASEPAPPERASKDPQPDAVDRWGQASFPASDPPPGWKGTDAAPPARP